MKKLFFSSLSLFFLFTFSSCKKSVESDLIVKDLEVNISPNINIGYVAKNSNAIVGSYAVYNPTQEFRTVYGFNLNFTNYDGVIDYVYYKSNNSSNWIKIIAADYISITINQTLRINESSQMINIMIHRTNLYISEPRVVWIKCSSISSDRGSIIPNAYSEISFSVSN